MGNAAARARPSTRPGSHETRRVLVVDDDPRIGRLIGRVVAHEGARLRVLAGAEGFVRTLEEFAPHVVFLDLQLASGDGVELMRALARRREPLTVVLVSGMDRRVVDTTWTLGRSMGLQMTAPLHKPFTPAAVRERIVQPVAPAAPARAPDLDTRRGALIEALEAGHMVPYFQPMVRARDGRVVRIEALARWLHPSAGTVLPARFLALVEHHGLMRRLTLTVLDQALTLARSLEPRGHALEVAVNLSPVLLRDVDFPDAAEEVIAAHRWPTRRLVLELTEHRGLDYVERAMDVLVRLRLKGARLSLDDYGTGFSTVGQLYRLPFCELKIDKSFVTPGPQDRRAAAIVRSTIELAHGDGLEVVAEGVEDRSSLRWLVTAGCDLIQGYHLSAPLPAAEFGHWLERHEAGLCARRGPRRD